MSSGGEESSMLRRTSAYFRGRDSIVIVSETRGTIYKYISFFLGVHYLLNGARNIVMCDTALPYEGDMGQALLNEIWPDCRSNGFQRFLSIFVGSYVVLLGTVRMLMIRAKTVADFYHSMLLLVYADFWVAIGIWCMGYSQIPSLEQIIQPFCVCYEFYVLLVARRAYMSRRNKKDAINKGH